MAEDTVNKDSLLVSKDKLVGADHLGARETIDTPFGKMVVKTVSRDAVIRARSANDAGDQNQWEIIILADGIVEPAMTEEEVREWRLKSKSGDIDEVTGEVLRVSGLLPGEEDAQEKKGSSPEAT